MQEVRKLFQQRFGVAPSQIVQAPGRLELLGNHTDYNEGLVLALAVDKYIHIAANPRKDGKIALHSSAYPETETFACDKIEPSPTVPWANYVKGVLAQLLRAGVHFTGFNAAIHGSIPLGAGMSSSAALEIATALAVRRLFPFRLTEHHRSPPPPHDDHGNLPCLDRTEKMRLAKLCQAAEVEFVGVRCGLLDQISSLFGKAGHVIEIDCRFTTVSHETMPPGVTVVVCNSGVKHALAAGEYNVLRGHCEAAARTLGVSALRSATLQQLEANKDRLNQRDYECACHVIGENHRVVAGARAVSSGDIKQFGQYLFQSHDSSRDLLRNSCPELDALVELARSHNDCIGARLTGGGFGGATINLVRDGAVNHFIDGMSAHYTQRTGRELEAWVCEIVDGAH